MALIGPEHIEPGDIFPIITKGTDLIDVRWWTVTTVFPTVIRATSEGEHRTFSITFVRYCLTTSDDLFS